VVAGNFHSILQSYPRGGFVALIFANVNITVKLSASIIKETIFAYVDSEQNQVERPSGSLRPIDENNGGATS